MTQTYYPFDAGAGANVTEAQWREMARLWLPTGVIDGELNELAVSERAAGANLSVDVATGVAWIRGHYFKSDAVENLAISAAHATLGRIDRVIVRVDFTANTVALAVLEGTAAASPAAPSLTQNTSTWEISLAQVSVPATDTTIANAQITSERTIIKAPGFDHSTAPTNGQTWVFDSTSGLWEPGSSGTSGPTVVRKSADESATSSATLQDDDELLFAVGADETWAFETVLFVTGNGTNDLKVAFNGPAGSSLYYGGVGPVQTATTPTGADANFGVGNAADAAIHYAAINTNLPNITTVILRGVIVNGGTAGNCVLRWAQSVSDAGATTVKQHSHIIATQEV